MNDDIKSYSMPDIHLMTDIETMDTNPNAAIIAVGAVIFDPRANNNVDNLDDYYSANFSLESNEKIGRSFSASTILWWMKPEFQEARQASFMGETVPIAIGMANFIAWINKQSPKPTRIWAKSPDFDCSILKNACDQLNIIWPFKFFESRCVRTALEMAYPEGDYPEIDAGVAHDALADTKKQVIQIQNAYHKLGI